MVEEMINKHAKAYASEYGKWRIAQFTPSLSAALAIKPIKEHYYVSRDGKSRTGLLSFERAQEVLQKLREDACNEAAARSDEAMQICVPDWYNEYYNEAV